MAINPFVWLIVKLIQLYFWIVVAAVVMTWLIAFNVVNARNDIVRNIGYFLYRATEPVLAPIRRVLPSMGSFDLSPLILLLGLEFLERLIYWVYFKAIT